MRYAVSDFSHLVERIPGKWRLLEVDLDSAEVLKKITERKPAPLGYRDFGSALPKVFDDKIQVVFQERIESQDAQNLPSAQEVFNSMPLLGEFVGTKGVVVRYALARPLPSYRGFARIPF